MTDATYYLEQIEHYKAQRDAAQHLADRYRHALDATAPAVRLAEQLQQLMAGNAGRALDLTELAAKVLDVDPGRLVLTLTVRPEENRVRRYLDSALYAHYGQMSPEPGDYLSDCGDDQ